MNKTMKLYRLNIILLLLITGIIFSPDIYSQSQWLDYGSENSVSIEFYKPIVPQDSFFSSVTPAYKTFSGAIFISGRYNIWKDFTLTTELPIATGEKDDTSSANVDGGTKIGNPYIGGEYRLPESPIMFSLGLRIPVASKEATDAIFSATRGDISRSDAFIRKIVPIIASVNYKTISESNILLQGSLGGEWWFNSKAVGLEVQPDFSVNYSLQAGYLHKHVHVIAGVTGTYYVSSSPRFFEKPTFLQYGILITVPYKNIRPGLSFKVPGESAKDLFNYVIGFNFTYSLK